METVLFHSVVGKLTFAREQTLRTSCWSRSINIWFIFPNEHLYVSSMYTRTQQLSSLFVDPFYLRNTNTSVATPDSALCGAHPSCLTLPHKQGRGRRGRGEDSKRNERHYYAARPLSSRHMTFTQLSELSKQVFPALCEAQQVMAREPKKGACLRGEKGDKLSIKGLDPKRQIRQYWNDMRVSCCALFYATLMPRPSKRTLTPAATWWAVHCSLVWSEADHRLPHCGHIQPWSLALGRRGLWI